MLVLAALVIGLIFYLRNMMAVPATVREGLGVRASMRRSKVLAQGAKGKLFLVLLIAVALYFAMSLLLGTLLFVAVTVYHGARSFFVGEMIGLAIVFVGYTLISPVVMIGTAAIAVPSQAHQGVAAMRPSPGSASRDATAAASRSVPEIRITRTDAQSGRPSVRLSSAFVPEWIAFSTPATTVAT